MTASVVDAPWHKAPCVSLWWLFHAPEQTGRPLRLSGPGEAEAWCAICPALAACRRLPPPKLDHPWVVQAGRVWRKPRTQPKGTEQ